MGGAMRIRPYVLATALLAVLSLVMASAASAARYDSDTLLVKFRSGTSAAEKRAALSVPGVGADRGQIAGIGTHVVSVSRDPAVLARVLSRSAVVKYAEPNFVLRAQATPNDPLFVDEYGLNNLGQTGGSPDADIDAPEGWDLAGLSAFPATGGVKVGIVDTGITQTHEDLVGKTVDCGQSTGGAVMSGACVDDNGHGTHVAGTITANANNARGVTGVAFNSPLSICKALSGPLGQGTTSDVASCITWVTDRGAKVISMSLGGGAATTLQNAVRYAASHDVLVLAAAGNDGNATLEYPAAYARSSRSRPPMRAMRTPRSRTRTPTSRSPRRASTC